MWPKPTSWLYPQPLLLMPNNKRVLPFCKLPWSRMLLRIKLGHTCWSQCLKWHTFSSSKLLVILRSRLFCIFKNQLLPSANLSSALPWPSEIPPLKIILTNFIILICLSDCLPLWTTSNLGTKILFSISLWGGI